MNIRPVIRSQVNEVFRLYDAYDRPKDSNPPAESAWSTIERVRNQDGEIFVAEVEGRVVGTYAIYVCHNLTRGGRPFAVVENVICDPRFRRRGIGTALMEHAKDFASNWGCFKLILQTGATRTANHAFYEACGFRGDKRGYQVRFSSE